MKTAAETNQANHFNENGFERNFLILRTQRRPRSENWIIMDSSKMNLDCASRAVSGRKKIDPNVVPRF